MPEYHSPQSLMVPRIQSLGKHVCQLKLCRYLHHADHSALCVLLYFQESQLKVLRPFAELVNNNHSKARCTQELLLLRLKSLLLLCVLAGWFLQERKEREANEQQQREAPRKIPRCVSCVTSISGRTTSKQSTTSAKRNMTSCLDRMTSSKQSTTSSKPSTSCDG